MVIRFGRFGFLFIGSTMNFLTGQRFDAGITLAWGKRDAPLYELQYRLVWSLTWNWLPDRIYRSLDAPQSSRWTGRDRKFIGFGPWQRKLTVIRSTWRSKMFVYITGGKERAAAKHIKYVAPAGDKKFVKGEVPADWMEGDKPRGFAVEFKFGRAEVDERLGEYMIAAGIAQRTNLVRSGKALLTGLAGMIAGR